MKFGKILASVLVLLAALMLVQTVSGQTQAFSYYGNDSGYYFPSYQVTEDNCEKGQGQDFLIQIPPGACEPVVVRSDLLEEQNVAVFCRMVGLKINPLIEVPYIKSVTVPQSTLNKGIVGVTFHPYRTAIASSSSQITGTPLSNQLGYLVVVLKQQPVEKNIPEFVNVNLTARIKYDLTTAFGVGLNELLLPELEDTEWNSRYQEFSYWHGKGFARADNIKENSATIKLYLSSNSPYSTFELKAGDKKLVYMPGSYCSYGTEVKLNSITYPQTKAELIVDGNKVDAIKGMTILNGCTVNNIESLNFGTGGRVELRCVDKTYSISKSPSRAMLNVNGTAAWNSTGDILGRANNLDYSLVFAGKVFIIKEAINVAVIGKGLTAKEISDTNANLQKLFSSGEFTSTEMIRTEAKKKIDTGKMEVLIGFDKITNPLGDIQIVEIEGLKEATYAEIPTKYYTNAIEGFEDVAANWPFISKADGTLLGEKALYEAATKAEKFQKSTDAVRLWKQLIATYPDSKLKADAETSLSLISSGDKVNVISVKGESHTIILKDVSEPSPAEAGASILVNGESKEVSINGEINANWTVSEIKTNSVIFRYIGPQISGVSYSQQEVLVGQTPTYLQSGLSVKVNKVNLKKYARISISPYSKEGDMLANFSVHIGIEKRAIQLSTEQTQDLVTQLDKTIKEWTDARDKLGKLVESWKKACFVGSAALWAKNLIFGGGAMARQQAMRDSLVANSEGTVYNGYMAFCSDKKNWKESNFDKSKGEKVPVSISDCIYQKSKEISSRMDWNNNIIKTTNEMMSKCSSDAKKSRGALKGSYVDEASFNACINKAIKEKYSSLTVSKAVKEGEDSLPTLKSENILSEDNLKSLEEKGSLGKTDTKELVSMLENKKLCDEGKLKGTVCDGLDGINSRIYDKFTSYNKIIEVGKQSAASTSAYGGFLNTVVNTQVYTEGVKTATATVVSKGDFKDSSLIGNIANVALLPVNIMPTKENPTSVQGSFIFELLGDPAATSFEVGKKIFEITKSKDGKDTITPVAETDPRYTELKKISTINAAKSCNNPGAQIDLQYWDSGPFKGLPAIIPLDGPNGAPGSGTMGWYAAIKGYPDTIKAGATSSQPYAESGQPRNFYICNVGVNKMVNFADEPTGDESCCQYFALTETYTGTQTLPGMNQKQTEEMVNRAIACIKKAASSYGSTKAGQQIDLGLCGKQKVAEPKSLVPNVQCEDFMPASDCRIMYNLCDPVICPASRCNMGGRFTVSDVIQTGVIGSLVLCLPNVKEGIIMPVCLSGLHAGLDGYITILKSAQGCLKESLATGKTVGICDQLTSIYLCEFFWKQITPFIRTGVPEFIERTLLGRRTGGEYLTLKAAWDNSISSVQYFTDYYGVNALNAFKIRTTEEAGTAICKAFVGIRYPDSATLLDELSKPESPAQINAWFDEIEFSSVIVPTTSQYKVFWHIYAGNDQPAYYSVYLKTPPLISGYALPNQYVVATGYIEKGNFDEQSKDFTYPAGYKEICVRINTKDYCGFKKVTSGFATQYLSDVYLKEQTTPEYQITSEEDCASGAASFVPSSALSLLVQPSAGGLMETIQPEIYKRGIIRVCSQENPGVGVNEARWNRVGFCDSNKKIGCWVDRQSVENAITDLKLENETLTEAQRISREILGKDFGYINETDSQTRLTDAKKLADEAAVKIKKLDKTASEAAIQAVIGDAETKLQELIKNSVSEQVKAEAKLTLALMYNHVADQIMEAPLPILIIEIPGLGGIGGVSSVRCPGNTYKSQIDSILGSKIKSWPSYDASALVQAIITVESSASPSAVSAKNAIGLMQITLPTAQKFQSGITAEQLAVENTNLKIGIAYLEDLVNTFNSKPQSGLNSAEAAVVAYFTGQETNGNLHNDWRTRSDKISTGQQYLDKVKSAYASCNTLNQITSVTGTMQDKICKIAKLYAVNKVEVTRNGDPTATCARFVSEVLNYAGARTMSVGTCDSVEMLETWLKNNNAKEIKIADLQCGDIVIIKTDLVPRHAGIFKEKGIMIGEPGAGQPAQEQAVTASNFIKAYRASESGTVPPSSDFAVVSSGGAGTANVEPPAEANAVLKYTADADTDLNSIAVKFYLLSPTANTQSYVTRIKNMNPKIGDKVLKGDSVSIYFTSAEFASFESSVIDNQKYLTCEICGNENLLNKAATSIGLGSCNPEKCDSINQKIVKLSSRINNVDSYSMESEKCFFNGNSCESCVNLNSCTEIGDEDTCNDQNCYARSAIRGIKLNCEWVMTHAGGETRVICSNKT
jgi:soluble lytic murein transglycosylase